MNAWSTCCGQRKPHTHSDDSRQPLLQSTPGPSPSQQDAPQYRTWYWKGRRYRERINPPVSAPQPLQQPARPAPATVVLAASKESQKSSIANAATIIVTAQYLDGALRCAIGGKEVLKNRGNRMVWDQLWDRLAADSSTRPARQNKGDFAVSVVNGKMTQIQQRIS